MHNTTNRPTNRPSAIGHRPSVIGQKASTMLRHGLVASLLAFAAGSAYAQDPGPWLVNTGGDLQIVHGAVPQDPVGGGVISLTGGANDQVITYGATADIYAQRGPVGAMLGGGDDARIVYRQPMLPAATTVARAGDGPRS